MDTRLRRDVAWNLVPVVLLGAVGLGLNFLIAAWWGASTLGVFNLVTIAFFAFAVLGACGIQFSVLRAVAEKVDSPDETAAIVVGALVPNVALSLAATGLFLLARGPISTLHGSPAVAEGMLWATPGLFCFAVNKVLLSVVNGLRRMRAFAVYTSLRYFLIGVGLMVARIASVAPEHLPVIWTLVEVPLFLVLSVELVSTVALRRRTGWRRWTRIHLDYGVRGVSSTIIQEINSKLDLWMLGAGGIGKDLIGVYSLAAAVYEGAMQLGVVVQNNLNPIIARAFAEGRLTDVEALVRRTRRWFVPALSGMCAVGAAAYPFVVPQMVGNPAFAAGAVPFAILMAGLAIGSPYVAFYQFLLMVGQPGSYTLFIAIAGVTSFASNLVLIPHFGVNGAAISTVITSVVMILVLRYMARKRAGVRL